MYYVINAISSSTNLNPIELLGISCQDLEN